MPLFGPICGAVIALGGVWLMNSGNTARQRQQLEHDAKERATERLLLLRRELYKSAAVEMQRVHNHLAILPNLDLEKVDIGDGLQIMFALATNISLVAEPETVSVVNQLVVAYTALLFELTELLLPIVGAKAGLRSAEVVCAAAQLDVDRLQEKWTTERESAAPNESRLSELQCRHSVLASKATRLHDVKLAALIELEAARKPFHALLVNRLIGLSELQFSVLEAVRSELGVGGDLSQLRSEAAKQTADLEGRMRQLSHRIADAQSSLLDTTSTTP
jgi:hypothetical protein